MSTENLDDGSGSTTPPLPDAPKEEEESNHVGNGTSSLLSNVTELESVDTDPLTSNSSDIELEKRRPSLGEIDENQEIIGDSNDPTPDLIENGVNLDEDEKDNNNNSNNNTNNSNNNNNSENENNNNNNNNNNNSKDSGEARILGLDEDEDDYNNNSTDSTNSSNSSSREGNGEETGATIESDSDSLGTGTLGYDEEGRMLPAFEHVDDELLSFNSESDFSIFQKQLNGDIPLQRVKYVFFFFFCLFD